MRLFTDKPWVLTTYEVRDPVTLEWIKEDNPLEYVVFTFRTNGTYELREVRPNGQINADSGTWSFEETETKICFSDTDVSLVTIEELSA